MKKEFLHSTPKDIQKVFQNKPNLGTIWKTLTPLGRNEFICWITLAKKEETRNKRIERMTENLLEGKRRPCCWAGCPHR